MARPVLLLVDDEPDLALILGRVARRANLEFVSFGDAHSALRAMRDSRPELTLLDINLPGMSGLDLLIAVREDESLFPSKVALFCQSGMKGDIATGWAAGADFLVCKDLLATPDAIQRRLTEILAHSNGRFRADFLTCPSPEEPVTCDWTTLQESAFVLSANRILGDEVVEQVFRRALVQSFGADSWLEAGTYRLPADRLPSSLARTSLSRLFASLADQMWCLLGSDGAAPLTAQLTNAHTRLLG